MVRGAHQQDEIHSGHIGADVAGALGGLDESSDRAEQAIAKCGDRRIRLAIPAPGRGQILARIEAASIRSTDLRVVAGVYREMLTLDSPYIPGNGFAKTVTELGPDATAFAVGDEIFGRRCIAGCAWRRRRTHRP